jgi:hypothetical protein
MLFMLPSPKSPIQRLTPSVPRVGDSSATMPVMVIGRTTACSTRPSRPRRRSPLAAAAPPGDRSRRAREAMVNSLLPETPSTVTPLATTERNVFSVLFLQPFETKKWLLILQPPKSSKGTAT